MKIISIDPDTDLSGVAIYENNKYTILKLDLWAVADMIKTQNFDTVLIEGGWLNKGTFRANAENSPAKNAAIGKNVGANAEIGRQLEKLCQKIGVNYKIIRPTAKKVDAAMFAAIIQYRGRTNQDQRDAAMQLYRFLKEIKINSIIQKKA